MATMVMVFWVWLTLNVPPLISGRDTEFISTGVNSQISSEFINPSLNMELRTLRYFPQGQKNCYTLKPEAGKSSNYLIRAVFMYGNYDGKNQTPVFELYLGVNPWITVKDEYVVYEIIHSPLTDTIHVCLMNNNTGVPYISALELRQMDNSIYQIGAGSALALISRINLGGSNKTIRYGDDIYDRKWIHGQESEWIPMTPIFTIDTTSNTYKVPAKVLGTAIKCVSGPINVSWTSKSSNSKFYVYILAEIEKLKGGKQRTIHIRYNDLDNLDTITLEYQKAQSVAKFPFSGEATYNFSISSGDSNNLPPILNAYEGRWNLSSRQLSGNIAASFSNLRLIQSLDLSHNELTGPIPEFLAQLPSLTVLNLMGNKLEGAVPKALMEKHNSGTLTLNYGLLSKHSIQ